MNKKIGWTKIDSIKLDPEVGSLDPAFPWPDLGCPGRRRSTYAPLQVAVRAPPSPMQVPFVPHSDRSRSWGRLEVEVGGDGGREMIRIVVVWDDMVVIYSFCSEAGSLKCKVFP